MLAMQQQRQQVNGSSGPDLSNQTSAMESTSRSLIIVDDYQRQAMGLSQQTVNANNASTQNQNQKNHHSTQMPLHK